ATYARSRAYWQARLADFPDAPALPFAKSPADLGVPRFARVAASIDAASWRALKARAASSGITPTVALVAAFADVLAAWSKDPRFTINLTLFNPLPVHAQVHDIVGDFTSLTLLAADTSMRESFEARARRLQKQLWEDIDHSHVSGVQILNDLSAARG